MPFESPDYALGDLLRGVHEGKIQLPDFQREWKWDDDRIAGLLASITLGFPVGVVMMLDVLGVDDMNFAKRTVAGVGDRPGIDAERLLLDGQQRLTSLYQSLWSKTPVATADPRGKKLSRWYYLDIAATLDPNADREEAILSVPAEKVIRADFGRAIAADYSTRTLECQNEVFPLSGVFDNAVRNEWMVTYLKLDEDGMAARLDRWNEFQTNVLNNLLQYKLPVIVLTKGTPKEAVCTVFEKVNTGGVALNVFELLTATFAADNFRLNDDWKARKARLDERPVLRTVANTDLLQGVALLTSLTRKQGFTGPESETPGVSCKRRDILRLTLSDYERWAEPVTRGLLWAAEFLAGEHIFKADDLPYRTQLVPIAAIHAALGPAMETHGIVDQLRRWYWCGVLGELYGGTTETRIGRDLEQFIPWTTGGPEPGTVYEAAFQPSRLLTLRTRNSAAYKGIYALLMRSNCEDWAKAKAISLASFFDYSIDIHHIFPKAWCEKHKIDAAQRESIVNKTAISSETNQSIGGRAPADYLARLEKKSGIAARTLDAIVATHAIDPRHLRANDFDAFFGDREGRLLHLIGEAMGKHPPSESDESEGTEAGFEPEPEDIDESELPSALSQLEAVITQNGLLTPQVPGEVLDGDAGEALAVADAIWHQGLKAADATKVALLFDPDEEMEARLVTLGYSCVVGLDDLDELTATDAAPATSRPADPSITERAQLSLRELVDRAGGPAGSDYIPVDHVAVVKDLFNEWAARYGEPTSRGIFFSGRPGLWHSLDELVPLTNRRRWNRLRFAVIAALEGENWVRRSPPRGSAFDILDGNRP